jgi:hypothetical protein
MEDESGELHCSFCAGSDWQREEEWQTPQSASGHLAGPAERKKKKEKQRERYSERTRSERRESQQSDHWRDPSRKKREGGESHRSHTYTQVQVTQVTSHKSQVTHAAQRGKVSEVSKAQGQPVSTVRVVVVVVVAIRVGAELCGGIAHSSPGLCGRSSCRSPFLDVTSGRYGESARARARESSKTREGPRARGGEEVGR